MSIPWFPLHVTAYEADTTHLTMEEDGAYNRLLRLCWRTPGCSIPDDREWIKRRLRVDDETYDRAVVPVLAEYFEIAEARLFNKRLSAEFERISETTEKRVEAGKKGGRKTKPLETNGISESRAKAGLKHKDIDKDKDKEDTASAVSSATPAQAPDRFDALLDKLLAAAGIKGNPHPGLIVVATIMGLMDAGYDLDTDILPVIRSKAATMASPPRSWGYFEQPIRDAKAKRSQIASIPKPVEVEADWPGRVAAFRKSGTWANAWGPRPGQAGCMAPAELLERAA